MAATSILGYIFCWCGYGFEPYVKAFLLTPPSPLLLIIIFNHSFSRLMLAG